MLFKRTIRGFSSRRLFISAIILCTVIILNSNLSPDLYFINWSPSEDLNCHYVNTNDVLQSAEDANFSPASESIFFIETSCHNGLDSRQACSVEAAARTHPDLEVYVLFTGPVKSFNGTLKVLEKFQNVRFARIHIVEYAKSTPAEKLVASGALNRTRWILYHTSDVLRFITLYKWSGVYLDLDALVVKSFKSLEKNWATRESDTELCSGAISFSDDALGRTVADLALRNLVDNYRGDSWAQNGPKVITRVMKEFCDTRDVSIMSGDTCKGFEIYSNALFQPIGWKEPERYFMKGDLDWPWVYVYHVWGASEAEISENSRFANLAKIYCPNIYESYSKEFGGS